MKTLIILTAPCGVGKSTIRELISNRNHLPDFACIDTDAVGLNWHDYKGTDHENQYQTDCLKRADEISGDKNIFFVSAGMNPPNAKPTAMTLSKASTNTVPGSNEAEESSSFLLITLIRHRKKLRV